MSQNSTPLTPAEPVSAGTDGRARPSLEATLAIEPEQKMGCPLFESHEEVDTVEQNLSFEGDADIETESAARGHASLLTLPSGRVAPV